MSTLKAVFRWAAGAVLAALGFQAVYTLLGVEAI
jgi:hypothetical protein